MSNSNNPHYNQEARMEVQSLFGGPTDAPEPNNQPNPLQGPELDNSFQSGVYYPHFDILFDESGQRQYPGRVSHNFNIPIPQERIQEYASGIGFCNSYPPFYYEPPVATQNPDVFSTAFGPNFFSTPLDLNCLPPHLDPLRLGNYQLQPSNQERIAQQLRERSQRSRRNENKRKHSPDEEPANNNNLQVPNCPPRVRRRTEDNEVLETEEELRRLPLEDTETEHSPIYTERLRKLVDFLIRKDDINREAFSENVMGGLWTSNQRVLTMRAKPWDQLWASRPKYRRMLAWTKLCEKDRKRVSESRDIECCSRCEFEWERSGKSSDDIVMLKPKELSGEEKTARQKEGAKLRNYFINMETVNIIDKVKRMIKNEHIDMWTLAEKVLADDTTTLDELIVQYDPNNKWYCKQDAMELFGRLWSWSNLKKVERDKVLKDHYENFKKPVFCRTTYPDDPEPQVNEEENDEREVNVPDEEVEIQEQDKDEDIDMNNIFGGLEGFFEAAEQAPILDN